MEIEPAGPTAATLVAPSSDPEADGDAALARLTAARGFLAAEWLGAILMLVSFTQLYFVVLGRLGSGALGLGVGLFTMAIGSFVFVRSRGYYHRLEFPYKPRWHTAAYVVAGSAAIFWLLFAIIALLVYLDVPVLND